MGSLRVHTRMLTECCSSPVGLPAAPIDVIPDCPPAAAAAAAAVAVLAPASIPGIVPLRPLLGERKRKRLPTALTRTGRAVLKGLSVRTAVVLPACCFVVSLRLFGPPERAVNDERFQIPGVVVLFRRAALLLVLFQEGKKIYVSSNFRFLYT